MNILQRCAMFIMPILAVAGCASTTITLSPSPQPPVCDRSASALVLWAPKWRADQKDVPQREAAALAGLDSFLAQSGCFARAQAQRVPDLGAQSMPQKIAAATGQFDRVVVIAVRELGPVVKLLSSAALVDGGTEVMLQITTYAPPDAAPQRTFTVHWQHGGQGVIKGVASLPADMHAALTAGLQPRAPQR